MKIPIVMKLVFIITGLMLIAALTITIGSSKKFIDAATLRESDANLNQAQATAGEVENTLRDLMDKARVVGGILYRNFGSEAERQAALDLAFRPDHDLVAVDLYSVKANNDKERVLVRRVVNEAYLKQYDFKAEAITAIRENLEKSGRFHLERPFNGEIAVTNSSFAAGGVPLVTFGLPLVQDENSGKITNIIVADMRLDKLQKLVRSVKERTLFIVDRQGYVLAHPDEKLVTAAKNVIDLSIVAKAIMSKGIPGQEPFVSNGEDFKGAFASTQFGPTVIAAVPESVILEPAQDARRISFFFTGIALSAALFFIVWFSTSLTQPLEALVTTTSELAKGNFDIKAKISTKDEVGELAMAFNHMIDGLKERDKVKSLFNKFHGTGIANKLITGEMKLGGEQREATVFFSDIRSFTSFSEKVQPHEVVEMLNEYFKIMVGIIQKNKGVVDKFIGDAIMAVWGAPESFGNDAANAIRACIEMRLALAQLNEQRKSRGAPELFIGMGVHTGGLIAGTIGSDDRMEYTVIGDSVNMASRIEAATKAYGTDLLVSEATYEKIKEHFTFEQAGTAVVKGKAEPLKLFKVTGYVDDQGQTIPVATPYSSYEAEHADKVKVA